MERWRLARRYPMQSAPTPIVKDLVLVGGGHSHVAVLKSFGMRPLPGVRLTLVTRDIHTPYSGMLPGLVAGHYTYDETHIDLGKLGRFAGARLIHDEVIGIDLESQRLRFADRPELGFDVLAINTGSTPGLRVPGAAGRVVPVKPINRFLPYWEQVVERTLAARGRARIGVVGAGAGGVELTLAMQYRLDRLLTDAGAAARPEFHVFSAPDRVLPTHNGWVQKRFLRVLEERGVKLHLGRRIAEVTDAGVRSENDEAFELDEVLWTTQASAPPWPREAGLAVNEGGFIEVDDTLQSTSHPGVFATGDVAAMVNHPREKAGVFAVRQGPPLARNLRLLLEGDELEDFQPQSEFLSLVSTGDRYAVASRSFWSLEGAWVWKWKDWIDRRFMTNFGDGLPPMESPTPPAPTGYTEAEIREKLGDVAMRCAGCGSKIGATALGRALERIEPFERPDVLAGMAAADDAATLRIPPGKDLVQTVDFFRAIVTDPYVFGRIIANHCLGDVFAMGAEPHSALAMAVVPYGLEEKIEDTLALLLEGANRTLREAGASLVGGHSSEGPELAMGLTINGLVNPGEALGKGGIRAGDRLILTKPVGTGTIFAAEMRGKATGRWVQAATEAMLVSNADAARIVREHGATACTDVTGFGLAGHLLEMLRASGAGARLELDSVPVLEGALETAEAGHLSSIQPENLRARHDIEADESVTASPRWPLLFDPQTAGGLLASVPEQRAEACLAALREAGYPKATSIGEAFERPGGSAPLAVTG